ncbi:MAG TPA: GGDEF domain-containing protein [Steroidobacteraceae bacterium]|nr:GGDEF domain-containing protein [Steroidobacteraceae bacterium]
MTTESTSPQDSERQLKLQPHRMRLALVALTNFAMLTFVLALYAWIGEARWPAVLQFGAAGIGLSALFVLIIARRWNLRVADKDLMVVQFCVATGVILGGLLLMPQLCVLFLIGVIDVFIFGMMRFEPRQFMFAWLLVSISTAAAMYSVRGQLGQVAVSDASLAILVLYVFMVLGQLTVFGTSVMALRTRLSERNRQLAESVERIQQLAARDDLTGAWNRRAFMELLADERARALRHGWMFGVVLLDIDHFKSVNDRFGHPAGDAVLRAFCEVANTGIRTTDRLGRLGGEEFIVLLISPSGIDAARIAAERIRAAVEAHDWNRIVPGLSLTTSLGVAVFERGETVESLIARADRALYAAKESGRNRTVMA